MFSAETPNEPIIFPNYKHGYHARRVEFEITLTDSLNTAFIIGIFSHGSFFNRHGNYSLILRMSLKN